ncbi:MAG: T9SS type A sorting domain-containing protein [Bacteroidota bacterium]
MKIILSLLFIGTVSLSSFGQSQLNNVDLGLFDNGRNGSSGVSGASLELSFRIKPGGGSYTALPAAEDLVVYLLAPKPNFSETDVVNIVQTNTALYGPTGSMFFQGVIDIGDPDYFYIPIVLQAPGGLNLSPLNSSTNAWAFAFTISFTPAKSSEQYRSVRIVDQNNNAFLTGFVGAPTFSYLQVDANNQLTPASLISLPVSLVNFSGYKSGSKNVLKWNTSNELNNAGFEVQRSSDGLSYSAIGFVSTQATGGNSSTELSYTFDDNNPVASKKNYYRLNQKDIDGRSKMSNTVVINGEKPTSIGISGIFPNPASHVVNVIIDAPKRDDVTLVLMDVLGKTIRQKVVNVETGSNTVPVEIGSLAHGSYMIKVLCKSSDCESAVSKFVKQ